MKIKILQIVSENEKQTKDGRPLFIGQFLGQNETGEAKLYKTFSRRLKEKVGQDWEGDIEEREFGGNKEIIFKPLDGGQGLWRSGSRPRDPEEERRIIRQNVLRTAMDWCVGNKRTETADVFLIAQQFEKWIYRKNDIEIEKTEEPKENVVIGVDREKMMDKVKEFNAKEEIDLNDLPFE